MKKITRKTIIILVVSIISLTFAATAVYAAANISEIEDLYLEFRTAQAQKAIDNGDLTQEEADEVIANILDRMEADENDAVPGFNRSFSLRGNDFVRGKMGMFKSNMFCDPVAVYAELTDQDADDVQAKLTDDTDIYALAEEAELLDEVKAALIANATERIDEEVADGRIDADRAVELKEELAERINSTTAGDHIGFGEKMPRGGRTNMPGGRGQNRNAVVEEDEV